jgi:hypothetical protein
MEKGHLILKWIHVSAGGSNSVTVSLTWDLLFKYNQILLIETNFIHTQHLYHILLITWQHTV